MNHLPCALLALALVASGAIAQDGSPASKKKDGVPATAIRVTPVIKTEIQRKQRLFETLQADRARADAKAKEAAPPSVRAMAPAPATASRVQVDPARIKLGSKRELMGYTHRYAQGDDCDDSARDVHPGASETCDNRDNNCDGAVDEGQKMRFFLDADGDGHGDPARRIEACPSDQQRAADAGQWLVTVGNDCNDADPDRWRDCAQ